MRRALGVCLTVAALVSGLSPTAGAAVEAGVVRIISGRDQEEGTGFIRCVVGDNAFIVTAYHVVDDSLHCNLEFYGQGVAGSIGEVIYANAGNDVAVVATRVPRGIDAKVLALDGGGIARGAEIVVCGFPQGGGGWKVFRGTFEANKDGFLEISAPGAYRGNSGGPVLTDGKVVGMVVQTRQRSGQKRIVAVPASILIEHLRSAVVCVEDVSKVRLGPVGFSDKALGRLEKWFPDADATDELEVVGLEELALQLEGNGLELSSTEAAGIPSIGIRLISVSRSKQNGNYLYSTTLELDRIDDASGEQTFRGTSNVPQLQGDDYNLIVVKSSFKKSIRHAVESMNLEGRELE